MYKNTQDIKMNGSGKNSMGQLLMLMGLGRKLKFINVKIPS